MKDKLENPEKPTAEGFPFNANVMLPTETTMVSYLDMKIHSLNKLVVDFKKIDVYVTLAINKKDEIYIRNYFNKAT